MALPSRIAPTTSIQSNLFTDLMPAQLRSDLDSATAELAGQIKEALGEPDLYGKLAPRWIVGVIPPAPGILAGIRATTNDPIVGYYEYGTRPHEIAARSRLALHFEWASAGTTAFFKHVQHPGTQAHDRLPVLRDRIEALARIAWGDAIDAAISIHVA